MSLPFDVVKDGLCEGKRVGNYRHANTYSITMDEGVDVLWDEGG